MKKMTAKRCAQLLCERDNILILTHRNPDGDTAGSAAALCRALRRMGKTAFLYPNADMSPRLRDYAGEYFAPEEFRAEFVTAVDVASEGMLPRGFEGRVDLCIDHHPSNTGYTAACCVNSANAACGQAVLEIIKSMTGSVTQEEATLLYIALSTDTGCFQYANTDASAMRAAAELLSLGVDNAAINTRFFRKISMARMKLEGLIYSSMEFYRDGQISVATITLKMLEEAGAAEDDCDDLAALAGKAENSLVSMTLREQADGSTKISLRSGAQVNSSEICAVFGGGGHAMAAGCTIPEKPAKAKALMLAVIDELWK